MTIAEALRLARQWLRAGRAAEVERLCRRVLAMKPDADAFQLLASALLMQNRRVEAADSIRALIHISPNSAEARFNLGMVLTPIDRDGAIEAYRGAVNCRPDFAEACNNLGDLLRQRGEPESAAAAIEKSLALRGDFLEAQFNLALCRLDQNRLAEAESLLRNVIARQPNLAEAHHALGNVLRTENLPAQALAAYQHALEINPDFVEARWHAALAMLTLGDFANGWPAYESRRQIRGVWRQPAFSQPTWRGEDLNGRRILLWTEQGFGDAIQFIRYAPWVTARGGHVSVLCQPELRRLFKGCETIERLFTTPEEATDFDVQCPLMSLPAIFRTTLETVPVSTPYLSVDPQLARQWTDRMSGARKIGLAWASGAGPGRSIPASELNLLRDVPGVTFYSLQKSSASPRPEVPMNDFTTDLNDFADTAALIDQLDLIITCDTAVAHLAGALGKPVWILLPHASPWRWMLDRSDSPWYRTVRLFRQPRPGDWASAVQAVVKLLDA